MSARPTRARGEHRLVVPRAVVRHGSSLLSDVTDLRIESGEPLTIVGESGSGKSLLAHALMGSLPRELDVEGTVVIDGTSFDLADRRSRQPLWGRHLALLPQEPVLALDPTMRVRGQVAEGVVGSPPRSRHARERADDWLEQLGVGATGAAYPHTLSGGMAQRVALAAATIGGARILIVDEPSKGLDAASLDRLAALLLAHVESGGLLITVTHDLDLAGRLGGQVAVMRQAAIVEHGPVAEVLASPQHPYTRRLVAAHPSEWSFGWMSEDAAAPSPDAEPLVTGRDLTKAYGSTPLFEDLSLTVRPGERWSLTGASGAGKTTLGDALLGLTPVDRGSVVHGARAGAGRLQKLYQDPSLSFPPRVPLAVALGDVVRRHRLDGARLPDLLGSVGLDPQILGRRPSQVSGGELQRIAIVRAMLLRPALILADEATSRLDLVSQAGTMDVLMREVADTGCALLLVTHDRGLAAATTEHGVALAPGHPAVVVRGRRPAPVPAAR